MALVSDSSLLALNVNAALAKAQRWVGGFFAPAPHSPEASLLEGTLRDPRLAPRVPMQNGEVDIGALSQLSSIGMKRGKLVTDASHPELMEGWRAMAKRAGLSSAPQLIIVDSPSFNAVTLSSNQEIAITSSLLKILDLRETLAVLGHELGHASSDHMKPRLIANLVAGGTGLAVAHQFIGKRGAFGGVLDKTIGRIGAGEWLLDKVYSRNGGQAMGFFTGLMTYLGFSMASTLVGKQFSVLPTELDADAKGAVISGDPKGLALALGTLRDHLPKSKFKMVIGRMFSGYPSFETRIARLEAMGSNPSAEVAINVSAPVPLANEPAPAMPAPKMAISQVALAERVGTPVVASQLS